MRVVLEGVRETLYRVYQVRCICGALRSQEFCNILTTDIEDTGAQLIISIKDTKNDYPRSFFISPVLYPFVKKYINLRSDDCNSNIFFFLLITKANVYVNQYDYQK